MDTDDKIAQLREYWANAAQEDWQTAYSIFSRANEFSAALFFLHLAFEKLLKALVVQKTKSHAPYSHNLLVLLERSGLTLADDAIALLADVNEFNMSGRYPSDKDAFKKKATKEFTEHYFSEGRLVWNLISQALDQTR